jgi:hypothetical protein
LCATLLGGRRVTTDPYSGRATERYANAAYCRLAGGASAVAHLARVAAHALPEHATQLDHLCRCAVWVCESVCCQGGLWYSLGGCRGGRALITPPPFSMPIPVINDDQ